LRLRGAGGLGRSGSIASILSVDVCSSSKAGPGQSCRASEPAAGAL